MGIWNGQNGGEEKNEISESHQSHKCCHSYCLMFLKLYLMVNWLLKNLSGSFNFQECGLVSMLAESFFVFNSKVIYYVAWIIEQLSWRCCRSLCGVYFENCKEVCAQAPSLSAFSWGSTWMGPCTIPVMLSQCCRQEPPALHLPRHKTGNVSGIQSLQRGTELKYIELFWGWCLIKEMELDTEMKQVILQAWDLGLLLLLWYIIIN